MQVEIHKYFESIVFGGNFLWENGHANKQTLRITAQASMYI